MANVFRRLVGNGKGTGTILISALLILAIFTIAANNLVVNNVSAGPAISPPLGGASPFAILAETAITSVPTSAITGDVGLSPNAGTGITGLTCVEVTGTIYVTSAGGSNIAGCAQTNPAFLTTAINDMMGAYTALGLETCDITYSGVKDLAGLSLVQGVYCADSFTLSGTLTLQGTGIWVFKTGASGTLSTSSGSHVVADDPCNVWWQVGALVTLGSNSVFQGNVLAGTSITLSTGASLNGRALAQAQDAFQSSTVTLNCPLVSLTTIATSLTTTITTAVGGVTSTIVTVLSSIASTITTTPIPPAPIPEYPWGVFWLVILMLPFYLLIKRRNRSN